MLLLLRFKHKYIVFPNKFPLFEIMWNRYINHRISMWEKETSKWDNWKWEKCTKIPRVWTSRTILYIYIYIYIYVLYTYVSLRSVCSFKFIWQLINVENSNKIKKQTWIQMNWKILECFVLSEKNPLGVGRKLLYLHSASSDLIPSQSLLMDWLFIYYLHFPLKFHPFNLPILNVSTKTCLLETLDLEPSFSVELS